MAEGGHDGSGWSSTDLWMQNGSYAIELKKSLKIVITNTQNRCADRDSNPSLGVGNA